MTRVLRIGLAGFGNVGRAFTRMLMERCSWLQELYGFEPQLVFIADSRGFLGSATGLPWSTIEKALAAPRGRISRLEGGVPGSVSEAIERFSIDVLVDVTPSRYDSPGEALSWYERVLSSGSAVVAADKAPLATSCSRLLWGAWGRRIFYKATVMAGTPLIDVLRWGLAGRVVTRVQGILNGTTNYVLGLAEQGMGFEEAIRDAQNKGYAEPDPSADLEGFDLAAKAAIVSCTLGVPKTLFEVERLDRVDEDAFRRAAEATARGRRLKYVALVEPSTGRAVVKLVEVSPENPLYRVDGVNNAVFIETAEAEPITLVGPGAGLSATASALLSDLVSAAYSLGVV